MTTRRDFLKLATAATLGLSGSVHAVEPIRRKGEARLKVGCAAYSFKGYMTAKEAPMTLVDFIEIAAEMGCDGVEVTSYYFPEPLNTQYLNLLKKKAFTFGLDICGMSVRNNFCVPPGATREKEVASVKEWIARAAELGAPCIRIFAGDAPAGIAEQEAVRWVAECIDECASAAADKGVVLALENHGKLTSKVENVIAIAKAIKTDWFGLNLDTGNFVSEDPYADVEKAGPYAVTTHVKTTVSYISGKRPADYRRIADILKKVGYRGYMVLEYEAKEDPKVVVPDVIRKMKEAIS